MTVLIGTSGWQYADWKPLLYPDLPQRRWLERHAELFATVEVNNAFYRLPKREVFEGWAARTPDDYVVTVKASRFLSHIKRLRDPQEPVARLMDRVAGLRSKLAGHADGQVAIGDAGLACFPGGTRVAVEPRHATWWDPGTREVLERRGAALVWADSYGEAVTPLWRTADWGYLRLHHGPGESWDYGYGGVRPWAVRLAETWDDDEDVYAYTNNDPTGAALRDARHLAAALHRRGRTTTRVELPPGAGQVA